MSTHDSEGSPNARSPRQVVVAVVSAMAVLAVVFALGVSFGKALAERGGQDQVDLARLDARQTGQGNGFAFQQPGAPGEPVVADAAPPCPSPVPAAAPSVAAVPVGANATSGSGDEADPSTATASETTSAPAPPRPARAEPAEPSRRPGPSEWCVQFGALQTRAEADRLVARLRGAGYVPYVQVADVPRKGRFYRVRVGHFAQREQADTLRERAASRHGLKGVTMGGR